MKRYINLEELVKGAGQTLFNKGKETKAKKWQGTKAPSDMYEALFIGLEAPMTGTQEEWVKMIKPNLPWADIHFEERVGEEPLNPGESYKVWPYYGRDKEMRTEGEKFSHTYMERFWPKFANQPFMGKGVGEEEPHRGIRYLYGDLFSVIYHLADDPDTRQAYLPIWFPEDTGVVHNGRVPCSLGYHFIIRDGFLHITYYLRSCDFLRHFRDDVYLAVRLAEWVRVMINTSRVDDKNKIKLGLFRLDIVSLHVFAQEYYSLKRDYGQDS